MKFKVLDLFCGAGGFAAGIDMHPNFQTVLGVDFDKFAIQTFSTNFVNAKTICGDLTNLDVQNQVIESAKQLGVNMIVGGPPCQGFSLKGKQLGLADPRNYLFETYLQIVSNVQPEVFVIENVKALVQSANGFFINQIRQAITKLGYFVNEQILNAKDFGVPQTRQRTIIIASKKQILDLPQPSSQTYVSVRDAISDLAYLNSGEGTYEANYQLPPQSQYQKQLRHDKLFNHVATNHSPSALAKLKLIAPEGDKKNPFTKTLYGKQKFLTTWSRLRWSDLSPTIDTRFDTPSNGRNSHPELNRAITPREAARLQSFFDHFVFVGPKTSICRQIGNAVPPLLSKAIADAIANQYLTSTKNLQLYCADAFKFVNVLINQNIKVDHIITDPPYLISQDHKFDTLKHPRTGLNFGKWDQEFDLLGWIKPYVQLLNDHGSIIIFCSYHYLSYIISELKNNGCEIKDLLIWEKTNPMPRNIKRRYVQDKEFAIWAIKKGAKWVFNKSKTTNYERSTFKIPLVSPKQRCGHPTQKPLALMEAIIKIHTNAHQLILDPFMGSGSTGVAALKLERKFIGIEKDPTYFQIAKQRFTKQDKSNA